MPEIKLILTETDLVTRLGNTEDHFVERKSKSDKGGWLRSTVAFANSTPVGYPAVLFIGVDNDGMIAEGLNIEDLMKSFSDFINEHTWPPIYSAPRVLTNAGRSCVAVIIPGSENRPHFAGKSYVRDGTQNRDASEEQFRELIVQRNSKARKLLEFRGKQITLEFLRMKGTPHVSRSANYWVLVDCNEFFVTLRIASKDDSTTRSLPLSSVDISWDDKYDQLKLVTEE